MTSELRADYLGTGRGGEVVGLNPNIRVYRYGKGQFFDCHCEHAVPLPDSLSEWSNSSNRPIRRRCEPRNPHTPFLFSVEGAGSLQDHLDAPALPHFVHRVTIRSSRWQQLHRRRDCLLPARPPIRCRGRRRCAASGRAAVAQAWRGLPTGKFLGSLRRLSSAGTPRPGTFTSLATIKCLKDMSE